MSRITTKRIRNWVTLLMSAVLVGSMGGWLLQRETIPRTVRIATGERDGLYFKVGRTIRGSLEERTGRSFLVVETRGSDENFRRLVQGEVDLAIVQGGAVPIEDVAVITPLFREFVFVIARKGTGITSVWQLAGKRVLLGQKGSGSRDSALKVLRHYGLSTGDLQGANDIPLNSLSDDDTIDAAIFTAGIEHPLLRELLATNRFEILSIQSASAIELMHPFVRNVEVPRGLFAEHPAVPPTRIPTVATIAYLICRSDAPPGLVQAALASIHEESLRLKVPTMITRQEATQYISTRLHPTAKRYFNPADHIGMMANVMESLAATKELMFALGAGIYLLWIRWRRLKEKEMQTMIDQQKEHLDGFLAQTLRIERAQMDCEDVDELSGFLAQVTQIKLQALQELTEEELRGNQAFSIFLEQCASLIGRIQLKIISLRRAADMNGGVM